MAYAIYSAEVRRLGPPAAIVVTSRMDASGDYFGESYLVLESGDVMAHRLSFDRQAIDGPFQLDDEYVLAEALNQAKIDLSDFLEKQYSKRPELAPIGSVTQADLKQLMRMRASGRAAGLEKVSALTECDDLKTALAPILHIPSIKVNIEDIGL